MTKAEFLERWLEDPNDMIRVEEPRYWRDDEEKFYGIKYASFSDYHGTIVERSNVRALDQDDTIGDFMTYQGSGYGGEAWGLTESDLDSMTSEQLDHLDDILVGLCDYPLIDDELHSEMEMEAEGEAWESWAESDFRAELENKFGETLTEHLTDDTLYRLFEEARERANEYWECETGGGMHINIERVAEHAEIICLLTLKGHESGEAATSPPWDKRRVCRAGEAVIARPADNLPEDSYIKYWVTPVEESRDWYQDAIGPYGVGVGADDIEVAL